MHSQDDYLRAGRAADLKNKGQRTIYRLFEILPGALSWGTLFLVAFLSWQKPIWVAIFIIFFVLYWFFKTIYLSFHLRSGYQKMREHQNIDWLEKLESLSSFPPTLEIKNWQDIYHLVVLPMHKEPLEIVRESFRALENCAYPKNKMLVVLGCEERVRKETEKTAETIEKEFGEKFFKFLITWHPADLPGEIDGHGSNDAWAVKKAKELLIDPLKIPYCRIIVSAFDVDTCVFPRYFSCLAWHYLTSEKPTKTAFQPIPLYINNIWQAPSFSRVFAFSATFWHTMNQERPDKLITFSSHSIPFKTLVDVNFKQTNVVSDDSRIFWQSFLHYNGDFRVKPLFYPVSMDANVAKSFWKTAVNIYKQQRRWAYGAGDIPYFLFGFLKNKKIPLRKKFFLGFYLISGHLSWATAPLLIFFLGWLPIVLGGPEFSKTLISYNLPRMTSDILTISMLGLIVSVYFSFLLLPSQLFPGRIKSKRLRYLMFALGWLLVPFVTIFFSAFPALDAQTRWLAGKYMGFWPTEKVRK